MSAVTDAALLASIGARLDDLFEGLDLDVPSRSAKLLDSFLRRGTDCVRRLDDAVTEADDPLVCQLAHSLKGMASNVGVEPVARCASALEEAARDGRVETYRSSVDALRIELTAAAPVIGAMRPAAVPSV